ncbi:MAG TPA: hypothetical protein VFM14_08980 [Gemmatimonadales bacterium]|nr:hypothetical protein [Gemmatimonadales bacterium]
MHPLVRCAGLAGLTLLAACSRADAPRSDQADAPATPAPASSPAVPNVVTVTAREYAFEVPQQIPAGVTTFRFMAQGKEPHHGIMVRLEDGKTFQDLAEAIKEPGPPPSWLHLDGGMMIGDPVAGSTITMTLTPGKYALICFIPSPDGVPHVAKGMMAPLEVMPTTGTPVAEPEADVVVRLADYDFQFSKPLTAGEHVIRVETAPGQPHELVLIHLGDGVTAQQVVATEMGTHKGPRPSYTYAGGVAPMEAGRHAYMHVNLKAGNYALICFMPDAKDGKPHLAHGMMKQFAVR